MIMDQQSEADTSGLNSILANIPPSPQVRLGGNSIFKGSPDLELSGSNGDDTGPVFDIQEEFASNQEKEGKTEKVEEDSESSKAESPSKPLSKKEEI